ncbi:hypothetical protein [Enhygromyxa salina]|uniref:hypothetical protein n=1 Tax=Enhygromyxa salina TaxID=215803 RepID=UPI001FD52761|nr:hypothetical protein [Enhygromyxa salina]
MDLLVSDSPDERNRVSDLLPLADGTFIAAGTLDLSPTNRGWLARYKPTGEQMWFVDTAAIDPEFSAVGDLVDDGQSGFWALGFAGWTDNRLIHLDRDGNVTSTTPVVSENGASVAVATIEFATTSVWLVGQLEGDAWLGLYDPTANTVTDLLIEDHLGFQDYIYAIGRGKDEIAVAATVSTSPNFDGDIPLIASTDVLVIHYNFQGIELQRSLLGPNTDPDFVRVASRIVSDASGRWFVGGPYIPRDTTALYQTWLAPLQAETHWTWTNDVSLGDVAGAENGVIVATNRLDTDASNVPITEGWLVNLGWDGAKLWDFGAVDDDVASYTHYVHQALAGVADGRFRTAGVTTSGEIPTVRSCLISQ